MTQWLERALNISSSVLDALKILAFCFCGGVAFMAAVQYAHDSHRNTDHWVEYLDVQPTREEYPIGYAPTFISHSVWHLPIRTAWPDVLRCLMLGGPEKGRVIGYRLKADDDGKPVREMHYEIVKPKITGFYDELGSLVGSSTDGGWTWAGQIPRYKAECWLEPNPVINPSPFVYRHVDVPDTEKFYFR